MQGKSDLFSVREWKEIGGYNKKLETIQFSSRIFQNILSQRSPETWPIYLLYRKLPCLLCIYETLREGRNI